MDEFKNRCRTCQYLAVHDDYASTGWCWQDDERIELAELETDENFRYTKINPKCKNDCWFPKKILKPIFDGLLEEE